MPPWTNKWQPYTGDLRLLATTLLAISGAGWLAGATPTTFGAAALGTLVIAGWYYTRHARRHHIFINLDPQMPDPATVIRACKLAHAYLMEHQQPLIMRIAACPALQKTPYRLNLNPAGQIVLHVAGQRAHNLRLGTAWLAEHPVPLPLSPHKVTTLHFIPTHGERYKVTTHPPTTLSPTFFIICLGAGALAIWLDLALLLAFSLSLAVQMWLLQRCQWQAN